MKSRSVRPGFCGVTALVGVVKAVAEVNFKGSEMGSNGLMVHLVEERGDWKVDKVEGRH